MANFLGPDPLQSTFFIPGSNTPGNGVQLFTYVAGSSTKTTVYKTQGGTAHTNPIVLDSGGNLPSGCQLWIPEGVSIKAVYAPANDTDPPASPYPMNLDNLSGINDVTETASQWVTGPTPTYVSGTSLTLVGDQTATLQVGRRIQTQNTAGTIYSTISSSVFASTTALGVRNDSGTLDSGLASLSYGLLSALNPSSPLLSEFYPISRNSSNTNGIVNLNLQSVTSGVIVTIPARSLTIGPTLATTQLTTTGVFIDFTDIPSGTRRVCMMYSGVSTNGNQTTIVQLGTSSNIATSSYAGGQGGAGNGQSWSNLSLTTGFGFSGGGGATSSPHGTLTLSLLDPATNTWTAAGMCCRSDVSTAVFLCVAGSRPLTSELTRIRLTTLTSTDTFDAGLINVTYE